MEIKFIRHAEKEKTGEDSFLTEKGIKQAEHLAERLKEEHFDEFYCSNMNRAKQTAEAISKKINMPFKIEESLNEFQSEIVIKNKREWTKEEKAHYRKLAAFLKKLSKRSNENKSVLIVAHGITNRVILSYLFRLNLKRIMPLMQAEGTINSIYWVEEFKNWRLIVWNDNHHIPKELRI